MDAWRVKLPSRWDELLDEAVKKTKEALHIAPDVNLVPRLHKLVLQRWDSSIKSPPYRLEDSRAHVATLIMVLSSQHEGGQINCTHDEGSSSWATEKFSAEYQYIAFHYDTIVDTEAIISGNRLALVYWLLDPGTEETTVYDTSALHGIDATTPTGTERRIEETSIGVYDEEEHSLVESTPYGEDEEFLCEDFPCEDFSCEDFPCEDIPVALPWLGPLRARRPITPAIQELEHVLRKWMPVAGLDDHPPYPSYTLEHNYDLDLSSCPIIQGNDNERVHALYMLAEELGYELYYTVLSQHVLPDCETGANERANKLARIVGSCGLKNFLQLHTGEAHICYESFNEHHGRSSRSLDIPNQSIIHSDSATEILDKRQRGTALNEDRYEKETFREIFYKPAVLIVPGRCVQVMNVSLWINLIYDGEADSMHSWLRHWSYLARKQEDLMHEEEIKSTCEAFLEEVEKILIDEDIERFSHNWSWSSSLDLVARMGLEINYSDIVQTTLTLRRLIDTFQARPVAEQFEDSETLQYPFEHVNYLGRLRWDEINWWISEHQSLRKRLKICDVVIQKVRRSVSGNMCPRASPAFLETWKKSRLQDALLEIAEPRPGDSLLLAKLTLEWPDELLRTCANDFVAERTLSANFILDDLRYYARILAQGKVTPDVTDRYIADYLAPAIAKSPVFRPCHNRKDPAPEVKICLIVKLGNHLGGIFPDVLLPLFKLLTTSFGVLLSFLKEAMGSPVWTVPTLLHKLGAQIIEPVIEKLEWHNSESERLADTNLVDTTDLITLIRFLCEPRLYMILQPQYDKLIAKMIMWKELDPRDVERCLSSLQYRDLKTRYEREWGPAASGTPWT